MLIASTMLVNYELCFEFQRCRIDLCKVFYSIFVNQVCYLLQCLLYLFLINISRISLECTKNGQWLENCEFFVGMYYCLYFT